jgi:hypothetical protein
VTCSSSRKPPCRAWPDGAGLNAFDATALAQDRPPAAPATGLEGNSGRFPMRTLRITGIASSASQRSV